MNSKTVFDHLLIVVKDIERSIEFYKLLGFKHIETIQRPKDKVAVMRMGQIKIEMMSFSEGKKTCHPPRKLTDIGFRHIGLKVEDINNIYERLKDKIQFDAPPRPITGRKGRLTVFLKDPDGLEIHFIQE